MRRVLGRIVELLFANKTGTAIARRFLPPLDGLLFRLTRGRVTMIQLVEPALVLETVGAKSGRPRHSPLLYVRDGDRFIVAGSNFGQAQHPGWSANLLHNADAVAHLRGKALPVRAEPITDEAERVRLWTRLDDLYIGYQRYREATRDIREVRMFALMPR